jgi:hypothetical protein
MTDVDQHRCDGHQRTLATLVAGTVIAGRCNREDTE